MRASESWASFCSLRLMTHHASNVHGKDATLKGDAACLVSGEDVARCSTYLSHGNTSHASATNNNFDERQEMPLNVHKCVVAQQHHHTAQSHCCLHVH